MGVLALLDAQAWVDGYDFTSDSNELRLATTAEEKDGTTFGSGGWRVRAGGLRSQQLDLAGYWQAGAGQVDPEAFAQLAVGQRAHTVAPQAAEGSTAYLFRAGRFRYEILGQLGELAPFRLASAGTDGQGVARGQVAKSKGVVSATGQVGSVLALGAPSATQFVWCTVHVFAAGTTLTLQLQSDDSAGFATPTTRATIGPLTTVGGTWMTRLAGPFAGETHWRLNASAITGSFTVAAAIAIQ